MSREKTDAGSLHSKLQAIDRAVMFRSRQFSPKIPRLGEGIDAFVSRKDPMREKILFRVQKA